MFSAYGNDVMYEIFNEPWGYKNDAATYVADMRKVIHAAGLPVERCILAGLYGAADIHSVARAGWEGFLSYHVYSFWLPAGQETRENYAAKVLWDLGNLSSRVYITEFGVGLDGLKSDIDKFDVEHDMSAHIDWRTATGDWQQESSSLDVEAELHNICTRNPETKWCRRWQASHLNATSFLAKEPNLGADVVAAQAGHDASVAVPVNEDGKNQRITIAFLRGLRDALNVLKDGGRGIRGLYHWHGWHNGDTWDFWDAANAKSSTMIQMIMSDLGQGTSNDSNDPFLSTDFIHDDQNVHMTTLRYLSPETVAECPVQCAAAHCQPGNAAILGGKHLTGSFCTHMCSPPYNGMRYCGVGEHFNLTGAVECGACARPAMCDGLPCWPEDLAQRAGPSKRGVAKAVFLQRHLSPL